MSKKSARRIMAVMPILFLLAGCATTSNPAPSSEANLPTSAPPEPSVTSTPPTPSSTPVGPPPLGDLVLSPNGLGPLEIGEPIDPVLATFDPEGCKTGQNQDLYPPDDPVWAAYLPNYPKAPSAVYGSSYDYYPFEPHHDDEGHLKWLRVRSPDLRTAAGIGIGSTGAELLAAYPDADVTEGSNALAYGIAGDRGRLVLEVRTENQGDSGPEAGTVYIIHVDPLEWGLSSISGGDTGGFCSVEV